MKSVVRLIALALFAFTGCIDTLPPGEDEASDTGEQEARFPIAPQDSCALKLPLACPSATPWSITYVGSMFTGTTTTATFDRGSVAGFTANAERELCTANQDIVITGIVHRGARLPRGVTAGIAPDGKSVRFSSPLPAGAMVPPASGDNTCALFCDDTAATAPGCNRGLTVSQNFKATAPGRSSTVRASGAVDTFSVNASTGEMRMTCKWTIPRALLSTTPSRRPDDVIATSNGSFLRGYDLSGRSLDAACQRISADFLCSPGNPSDGTDTSGPYQECIDSTSASCRSVFRGPDPCKCAIASCLRNSDCASNSCSASGCCLPVIR
jgi:hypothetical protein